MRRLDSARRTGCTRGTSDTLQIERDDERFARCSGNCDVRCVANALRTLAVDADAGDRFAQRGFQSIAKRGDAGGIFGKMLTRKLRGFAHPDDRGHTFRAGTHASFMLATAKDRLEMRSRTHIKRAHSLRPVELVRGK